MFIDSLGIIFLSYILGCVCTILLVLLAFIYYSEHVKEKILEQEQFPKSPPFPENHRLTNLTLETINYLFQFLFQELKDTGKLRRFIVKKLHIEFDDIKRTQIGQIFLRDISIESFSMGKECPMITDIQLERQGRDERNLIKNVVTRINIDYKDGFTMTLDVKLIFGYHCQLSIKVKRIVGCLRLEFRREPFSHWLVVFHTDPTIELDIKSYLFSRENRQLAHLITHHIRRIIRRKQTWPSYKIRYQPFFPSTKHPLFPEILCPNAEKLIPGRFLLAIQSCDRFHIPFEVIQEEEYPLIISMQISRENCQGFLRMNRKQWWKKNVNIRRNIQRMRVREVLYIDRKEFLIEHFEAIPDEIEDKERVINALKDERLFLMEIDHQQVDSLEQFQRLFNENDGQIRIVLGIPRLHCIQVPRAIQFANSFQRQTSTAIKPDTTMVLMMDEDFIPKAQSKHPFTQSSWAEIDPHSSSKVFDDQEFKFHVGADERFLNVCLWCEPRLDFDVPFVDRKRVLLGYASASLPQIVSDAQMSFNRETNIQLNFQSIYTDCSNSLGELSTHKSFDRNLIHGFVNIQIRHEPEFEMTFDDESSPSMEMDIESSMLTNPSLRRRQLRKSANSRVSSDASSYTPSRLSAIATSAYTKLRELKRRRASAKKGRNSSDLTAHEDISENDLQDMLNKCLCEDNHDGKSLEEFFHEKSLDHSMVYTKGNELSDELFGDLTPKDRRQNLETKITYLQQEIELQNQIRDEIIIEHNNPHTDEHTRKSLLVKLDNIDEKLQALYAFTFFHCSGLK